MKENWVDMSLIGAKTKGALAFARTTKMSEQECIISKREISSDNFFANMTVNMAHALIIADIQPNLNSFITMTV